MKFINHLTINTNHSRRSYRREVEDWAVDLLQMPLSEMLAGKTVPLPSPFSGYVITGAAEGQMMICSVWGQEINGSRPPIVTFGVARKSRGAKKLWILLWSGVYAPAAPLDAMPEAPFCAVRLEIGLSLHPDSAEWLGDFERCLAWTWLERQ